VWSAQTMNAGILIIGNEILSGQVQDANIAYMAQRLQELGIRLREVRVVEDVEKDIVKAVRALSQEMDYVFSTGGIGPTHDDITAASMAVAFEKPLVCSLEARDRLFARYPNPKAPEALTRMTIMPAGAQLIDNTVSAAPGFQIQNVFVMAGIPSIMRAMFEALVPNLKKGHQRTVREVIGAVVEGAIAQGLEDLARSFPQVEIGSYPYWNSENDHGVRVIIKSHNSQEASQVEAQVIDLMDDYKKQWAPLS